MKHFYTQINWPLDSNRALPGKIPIENPLQKSGDQRGGYRGRGGGAPLPPQFALGCLGKKTLGWPLDSNRALPGKIPMENPLHKSGDQRGGVQGGNPPAPIPPPFDLRIFVEDFL